MFTFFETNTISRKARLAAKLQLGLLEVKSKFDAEFRRFSLDLNDELSLENFNKLICDVHRLHDIPFFLTYTDREGDLLPINNEENFARALYVSKPLLRVVVQHKSNNQFDVKGYGNAHPKRNIISRLFEGEIPGTRPHPVPQKRIGMPENFRCVSAIIDVDIVPPTQRRVKLIKSQADIPLGFYIRDGYSASVTPSGEIEKSYGFFISKLLPGGLAAGTGLLAVNDEILEVNGIEVAGKTLDQVTDMMVANSSNLIITIKPFNQHSKSKVTMLDSNDEHPPMKNFSDLEGINNISLEDHNNDDDNDDVKEFIRLDPSGSSNTNMDIHYPNLLSMVRPDLLDGNICNSNNSKINDSFTVKSNSNGSGFSNPGSHKSKANLGLKTKSGQVIHDLQSLSDLHGNHEDLKFTEGNINFSVNNDCNNFLSMKSNDFYNFTNSSLRVSKPSSSREIKRKMSSCSINHNMTKFQ